MITSRHECKTVNLKSSVNLFQMLKKPQVSLDFGLSVKPLSKAVEPSQPTPMSPDEDHSDDIEEDIGIVFLRFSSLSFTSLL
jgi:hypothetical protein